MENVIFSSSQLQKNIRKFNKTDRWPPAPCGSPAARNVLFINFDAAKRGTNGKVLFLEPPGAGMMDKTIVLGAAGRKNDRKRIVLGAAKRGNNGKRIVFELSALNKQKIHKRKIR